jgi:DNA-binding transcriptional regulator GbsR (MarR family)
MTINPAATDFIQRTGIALQAYVPRAAAEVFALLVVTPEPLAIDEIATALRHSRAGVASSIRILDSHDVIARISRPGERRDLYDLREDAFPRLVARVSQRLRELADAARETTCEAPRLHEMMLTFERASASLDPRRPS